jgi:hydrogenase maturation protease
MRARIIGIGQESAGDDGVGLAVVRRLRAQAPAGVELHEVAEASALIPLLGPSSGSSSPVTIEHGGTVVIVDAVVGGGAPGEVLDLAPEEIAARGLRPLSSHGIDVAQALALSRELAPCVNSCVHIVGVSIERPSGPRPGLSPAVALAVPRAAALALARARRTSTPARE